MTQSSDPPFDDVVRPEYPQGACTRFEEITEAFCALPYIVIEPPFEPESARSSGDTSQVRSSGPGVGAQRAKCYESETVALYLDKLGVEGAQRTRLEAKFRAALWAEGFTCDECVNPLLVYLRAYNDLFDDSPTIPEDLTTVESSFITDILDIPEQYRDRIMSAYGFELANARNTLDESWSDCQAFQNYQDVAFILAYDPTGLQPLQAGGFCTTVLVPPVFTATTQRLCGAFFRRNPKTNDPFRLTTGISCFRAQYRVNDSLIGVLTGNIAFERETDDNCTFGCGTIEALAMINAYMQTDNIYQTGLVFGNPSQIDEIVKLQFIVYLINGYRDLLSSCSPHMSNDSPAAISVIGNRSFHQARFGTVFRTYNNNNLDASCP